MSEDIETVQIGDTDRVALDTVQIGDTDRVALKLVTTVTRLADVSFSKSLDPPNIPDFDSVQGIDFRPNGEQMFVSGDDRLYEYSLSNPWEIDSASYVQDVGPGVKSIEGLVWKPDGTRLYLAGAPNPDSNRAAEFHASTAWDISTLSEHSKTDPHGDPTDYAWRESDGKKLFAADPQLDQAHRFGIDPGWDMETLSHEQSISAPAANPNGVDIVGDGFWFYVADYGDNAIVEYELGTAWDLSTATERDRLSVGSEDSVALSIVWGDNQSKLYMCGSENDNVYQYD